MKILVRLPNWLGDVIMSTAFIDALLQLHPNAGIDVIVKYELVEIARLIPGVNNIFGFSKHTSPGVAGAFKFGKAFKSANYSVYFNLPVSLSSLVMAYASGANKKIGFTGGVGKFLLSNAYRRPFNVHRVDEYVSLAENSAGKKITQKRVKLSPVNTHPAKLKLVINFNSEAESRRMPVDKGSAILSSLSNYFDSEFVLIGSKKDISFINDVIAQVKESSRFRNMAGETDLLQLTAILSGASVLLTTDSGPAHLANSLGTPVVALFGAGNELNTSPYDKDNLTVLRAGKLSCEPCVRNTCQLYGIPKCMQLLDENAIIKALLVYLPNAQRRS